ncbi:hypothetical protein CPT03_13880 [Pedobacter ginsengisoli]|uniref:Uncharacterized protein n=1 Tax=Pedobacter ginsengisoli TaxID=363852 RepID=A0A2D1U7B9_9SPHI|nr:hypothetical protein CPT03_13880 [Pedobacter ginsengisoli]
MSSIVICHYDIYKNTKNKVFGMLHGKKKIPWGYNRFEFGKHNLFGYRTMNRAFSHNRATFQIE